MHMCRDMPGAWIITRLWRRGRNIYLVGCEKKSPDSFEAKAYVDTGPIEERVYAQHAGLGWIGKNSCLINEGLGSWLFLSEIICSLELGIDEPATDQCGSCTLCLEACPTGAIVEPWVVDSRDESL